MDFNSLLVSAGYDPTHVVVLRHRPTEPPLRRALPWLAVERPEVFNSYQRIHGPAVERALDKLRGKGYVAAFIGLTAGKAVFVGLYKIEPTCTPLTHDNFWKIKEHRELQKLGDRGLTEECDQIIRFDLTETNFHTLWKGRLVVEWTGGERSWWRRAHNNQLAVLAIHEDSLFEAEMPKWSDLALTWNDLRVIPTRWKQALAHWRGVYFIYDTTDCKGYVGAAYGSDNLLGRWQNYAATGHGGNKLLRARNPEDFIFSILQRVSPDLDADEVIRLENSWKLRLHTRHPGGLNDN